MNEKKKDFTICIPQKLLDLDMNIDSKTGILMAYCWIKRYASNDGYYETTIRRMIKKYGLLYDDKKTKMLPKQIINIKRGIDYLKENNYLNIEEGNYDILDDFFKVKIENNKLSEPFICLKYSYFDYILQNQKRVNKMNMLYILLFVLSCHNFRTKNGEREYFSVCSYSLDWLSKKLGFSTLSIYKYLKNLSIKQGDTGIAPLVKSKIWCFKIGDRILRFPNIYVENKEDAIELISYQRKYIREKFDRNDLPSDDYEFLEAANYDDLY